MDDRLLYGAEKWTGPQVTTADGVHWDPAAGDLLLEIPDADWRAYRSLTLELESDRRTAARVELRLETDTEGDADPLLGSVTWAVDWVGENPMQLWLGNLSRTGEAEALCPVRRVRLRQCEPGLWPTVLRVGALAVSTEAPLWPVNESDTLIDLGWHHAGARVQEWRAIAEGTHLPAGPLLIHSPQRPPRVNPAEGQPAEEGQPLWCYEYHWTEFGYTQGEEPGRICLERAFDLDLSGQREILAKLVWDPDLRLTVTALVEKDEAGLSEIDLISDGTAAEDWLTIGAPLEGARRLRAVRISAVETPERRLEGRQAMVALFWLLLRRDSVLDAEPVEEVVVRLAATHHPYPAQVETVTRQVQRVPSPEPPEPTQPFGDPLTDGLPFGFLVPRSELEDLRRRCQTGMAARIFQAIRDEADRAISTEIVDRNYYGSDLGGGIGQLKGVRGAGMRVFGPLTALAHLITGEKKYALAGRRWILRAALSDDWKAEHGGPADRPHVGEIEPYWSSFTGWYPRGFAGYMNHSFVVADSAFGVVVSYDLLYHCFTEAERELIEQAFIQHGTYILADTLRHARDFYVKMNQGILFALPLLMETAFLARKDPVYADLHAWTLAFMDEFARGPWNEEGVFGEGPGYGVGTLGELVEAFPILAACHGSRIEDLLPPALPQIMTYLLHVRSTWDDERFKQRPHFVGLSDGSEENWIHPAILAFYVRYLRDPVAQCLWKESYADKELQGLPTLLSLGEEIAPAEPELPPALVYRDQPMVFFRTGWRPGDTLVCLNAIRQVTCHGHKDRGAVTFEYNGEALLPDPGMIGYSEPASAAYHETFCHSTITFSQRSQLGGFASYATGISDFFSTSGERCPGDPAGIDWASVDLTAVYPQATRVQRQVLFLRPEVCLLYDEVEALAEEQIEVNFTCLAEPRRHAASGGYLGCTGRNHLLMATISDGPLSSTVSNWSTHWPEIPSYRLVWATERPVKTARFVTVLAPWPVGGPELQVTPIREGDLLGFEVQAGARTESFVTASRGGLEWQGLSTDGRALVTRRQGGVVVGAASLRDTQITSLVGEKGGKDPR